VFAGNRSPMTALDQWEVLRDNAVAPPRPLPMLPGRPRRSADATLLTAAVARGCSHDECVPQSPPHAEEAHADGGLRAAEVAGQVPARPVLPVVREDEPTVVRIEALDCRADRADGLHVAAVSRRTCGCAGNVEAPVTSITNRQTQRLATCDGRDPRARTPRVLAAVALTPGADERLLRRIFGCAAVSEDASRLPKTAQAKIAPVPLERPARAERSGLVHGRTVFTAEGRSAVRALPRNRSNSLTRASTRQIDAG
jgi:hypothetical protein